MKQLFLTAVAAFLATSSVWAQHPDGYLTDETRPKQYDFVKAPPSLTSGAFAYDFYYYQWGREQRDSAGVSEQALSDEAAPLYKVYGESNCIGINLSYETTPEIILLCERAVTDASIANTTVKNKYQRMRPFATFKEESLKPWTDEEEAKTLSYPSGHSSRGYIFALALCTVAPEYTTDIMLRAQAYAINRVICGHHWKTDTDASLLLAATMFANVVCTDEYQAQLKKARAEYQSLIGGGTRVTSPTLGDASPSAAIYDMQGYQLSGKPANGVYIQNGQKFIGK